MEASPDPRLARIARTLETRLRLEHSLGHRFIPLRTLPQDEVLPPPAGTDHPWRPGGSAASPAPDADGGVHSVDPHALPPGEPRPVPETLRAAGCTNELVWEWGPEETEAAIAPTRAECLVCRRCGLAESRTHVVFGEGALDTDLLFVGEAPGADEDRQGRPFVGRAGQLLTAMIEKGLKRPRASVYIGNVLKCRPPRNRDPRPDEIAACRGYLETQLGLIRPKVVVALGRIAGNILTEQNTSMKNLRGRWWAVNGIPLRAIYHPAYLLRQREAQGGKSQADRDTWEDLQAVEARLRGE